MKDLQISYTNQLNRNRFFFEKKKKRTGTNRLKSERLEKKLHKPTKKKQIFFWQEKKKNWNKSFKK